MVYMDSKIKDSLLRTFRHNHTMLAVVSKCRRPQAKQPSTLLILGLASKIAKNELELVRVKWPTLAILKM